VRFLVLDFAYGKIQNDVLLIYQGGNLQKAPIMKKRVNLTFPKRAISIPITYRLAKDFNIAANIIRAQVAPNKVGKMVLELSGDIDQLEESMDWMRSQDIEVSLHGREIVIDDTETFQLNFLRSRCVVCEQCITACPVNAISINL